MIRRSAARFMVRDGALNTTIFPKFPRRPVKHASGKPFVTVDRLRVRRAGAASALAAGCAAQTWLFTLPPYAPARNPDE